MVSILTIWSIIHLFVISDSGVHEDFRRMPCSLCRICLHRCQCHPENYLPTIELLELVFDKIADSNPNHGFLDILDENSLAWTAWNPDEDFHARILWRTFTFGHFCRCQTCPAWQCFSDLFLYSGKIVDLSFRLSRI